MRVRVLLRSQGGGQDPGPGQGVKHPGGQEADLVKGDALGPDPAAETGDDQGLEGVRKIHSS